MITLKPAYASVAQVLTDLGRSTFIETFQSDNTEANMNHYISKAFTIDKQLAEIADPKRQIIIAWHESDAIGFIHLLEGPADLSVTGPKPIEVLRLYVDARWHKKGVGASLMSHGIEWARTQGFLTMWLGVWERNPKAITFYQRFGFESVGTHFFRLGEDDQTDLIMVRAL